MSFAGAISSCSSQRLPCSERELGRRQRLGPRVGGQAELLERRARRLEPPRRRPARASVPATCAGARRRRAPAPAGRRAAPGPTRSRRSSADPTLGRGVNTAGSTVRTRVDVAGELREHARRPVLAGARSGAQPLGDLALHHHQPAPQARAARRSSAAAAASRPSRAGWPPSWSGPGSIPARSSLHGVSPDEIDVAEALGERLQLGPQALVQLDHDAPWRPRVRRARSARRRRPRPRAPRRPRSSSASRTIASSRLGSARKFCPRRRCLALARGTRAVASAVAQVRGGATSRTPARRSPRRLLQVLVAQDPAHLGQALGGRDHVGGLVGLAAHRLRRQDRGSRSRPAAARSGTDAGRLAQQLRLGIGDVARERAVPAALGRPLGPVRVRPRSSAGSPRRPRRRRAEGPEALRDGVLGAVAVAEVDHERLRHLRARPRSAPRTRGAAPRAASPRGRSRARSRRPPRPRRARPAAPAPRRRDS